MVLSSAAQQEVENISANVKKGLKMKLKLYAIFSIATFRGLVASL